MCVCVCVCLGGGGGGQKVIATAVSFTGEIALVNTIDGSDFSSRPDAL